MPRVDSPGCGRVHDSTTILQGTGGLHGVKSANGSGARGADAARFCSATVLSNLGCHGRKVPLHLSRFRPPSRLTEYCRTVGAMRGAQKGQSHHAVAVIMSVRIGAARASGRPLVGLPASRLAHPFRSNSGSADLPVPPGFNVEWAFTAQTTHGSPGSRLFEDRLSMSKRKRQRNRGRQRGQAAGSRHNRVARPLPRSEVPTVREVAAPVAAAPVAASPVNSPVPSSADAWKEQYGYVGRDLKLMSVTSAVLFAAIVVASFYLR